jgi:hypothetical protein
MFTYKGGVHMKCFSLLLLFLLLTGSVLAADIDGKWTGEIVGQGMEIAFTFKAEGTTLTGVHIVNGQETIFHSRSHWISAERQKFPTRGQFPAIRSR